MTSPALTKNFGSALVGSSVNGATETVTVTVTGGGQVDITSIVASGDFNVVGGTCVGALGLSNGSTCTLNLNFSPSAAGTRAGQLDITCGVFAAAIGVVGLTCDGVSRLAFNLLGTGLLQGVTESIPTMGREGLTLMALLMIAGSWLALRRR